jgi:hypothetical protein
MTVDSIEIPMPGTIAIFTPDGTEHRVMAAQATTDGLRMEIAPLDREEEIVAEPDGLYGTAVGGSSYHPTSVIGEVSNSMSGNVVLRVGHIIESGDGWTQVEHVVLTSAEARKLAAEILRVA